VFYAAVLLLAVAVTLVGFSPVAFGLVLFALRPPFLRRIPGSVGFAANLPVRSIEQLA
jgi:hypothetical protein